MNIPNEIISDILILSLNFNTVYKVHESLNYIKLCCHKFNIITKSIFFWKRIYEQLGWSKEIYPNEILTYFKPVNIFKHTINDESTDYLDFWEDIYLWKDFKIKMDNHNLHEDIMTIYNNTGKIISQTTIEIGQRPRFNDKYMFIQDKKCLSIFEEKQDKINLIRQENIDGYIFKVFEWNGPVILALYGITNESFGYSYYVLYFADKSQVTIGNDEDNVLWQAILDNGILYYCSILQKFIFYNFGKKTGKFLICVSEFPQMIIVKNNIVFFVEKHLIFAINPEEDIIIWTITEDNLIQMGIYFGDKNTNPFVTTQNFGLFTIYTPHRFHIFDIFTGQRLYIIDLNIDHDFDSVCNIIQHHDSYGYEVIIQKLINN